MTNFTSKELADLTIDEIVHIHVATTAEVLTKRHYVLSSLGRILGEMRHANCFKGSQTFVPPLCAFAVLDQLGSCYRRKSVAPARPEISGIKKALHNFCGYDQDSAESVHLYAFRNGLMHDASFTNQDHKKNWYYFRYNNDLPQVIKPAARQWDGTATDFSKDTTSFVNGQLLQDLASNTASQVAELCASGSGDLDVSVSREVLIHKYLLWLER